MGDKDRWALHNAAAVLKGLQALIDKDDEFARLIERRLETPGGGDVRGFWLSAAAASGRNPPNMLRERQAG